MSLCVGGGGGGGGAGRGGGELDGNGGSLDVKSPRTTIPGLSRQSNPKQESRNVRLFCPFRLGCLWRKAYTT